MRRHHGLSIGHHSAERLKIELGSATVPADLGQSLSVRGRDVQTASPGAVEITAGELYAVLHPVIHKIAQAVRETLGETPPEVAADVYDRGIILTGGGAMLHGLEDYMQTETKLVVRTADEPRLAIVRGLMQLFDEPLLLRRVTRNEPQSILAPDADAYGT
jgi:rod shape-determining protein MreB